MTVSVTALVAANNLECNMQSLSVSPASLGTLPTHSEGGETLLEIFPQHNLHGVKLALYSLDFQSDESYGNTLYHV